MTDKSGSEGEEEEGEVDDEEEEVEDKGTYMLHGRLMEALINHHIHF